MIKFSILVALYNGEKYLPRLFDSLIEQDIPWEDYEILCTDDCSTDNSVQLVEKYQKKYPNFKLIQNAKNQRVATNLNKAISICSGKYFWPIGQDDYIAPNCLKMLWNRLETDSLDVLLFNYRRVAEDESLINEPHVFDNNEKMSGVEFIKKQFADTDYCQYILGYEWRGVYRTDYWKEKNIRCVDGMNYEDTIIMLKAIVNSSSVASISDILYNYRVNSGSITYNKNFVKKGEYIYEFAFQVGQEEEKFYPELLQIDSNLAARFYNEILHRYNNFVFDIIRTPIAQKRKFYRLVHENEVVVKSKSEYFNWKAKVLLSPIGYPLSVLLGGVYRIKNHFSLFQEISLKILLRYGRSTLLG